MLPVLVNGKLISYLPKKGKLLNQYLASITHSSPKYKDTASFNFSTKNQIKSSEINKVTVV